ncbi:unnamed protein product, partial [Gulo gulo]
GPPVSPQNFSPKTARQKSIGSPSLSVHFSKIGCEEVNCRQKVKFQPGRASAQDSHKQLDRDRMNSFAKSRAQSMIFK